VKGVEREVASFRPRLRGMTFLPSLRSRRIGARFKGSYPLLREILVLWQRLRGQRNGSRSGGRLRQGGEDAEVGV